jgi:hypothetical protein
MKPPVTWHDEDHARDKRENALPLCAVPEQTEDLSGHEQETSGEKEPSWLQHRVWFQAPAPKTNQISTIKVTREQHIFENLVQNRDFTFDAYSPNSYTHME